MSKRSPIEFFFDINDPEFFSETVILNNSPGKYISHVFIKCPIYNKDSNGNKTQIGYKVSDDYVQQVDTDKYLVRINNTYYFNNSGTISWQYSFLNTKPLVFYPVNTVAMSNIISTTGPYLGTKGYVRLLPTADGLRKVKIIFVDGCRKINF
jgi:hypothetical protein